MFHTEFVGRFMTYLYKKCYVPSSSNSLVISVTWNTDFCVATMLLFYILGGWSILTII